MNRVIVAGCREFSDYELLCEKLDFLLAQLSDPVIVSGTCRGADQLGERYAAERGYPCNRFPADWNRYGRRAGYLRNRQMAENAEYLVAFWDGRTERSGTHMMITIARELGLPVRVIRY